MINIHNNRSSIIYSNFPRKSISLAETPQPIRKRTNPLFYAERPLYKG